MQAMQWPKMILHLAQIVYITNKNQIDFRLEEQGTWIWINFSEVEQSHTAFFYRCFRVYFYSMIFLDRESWGCGGGCRIIARGNLHFYRLIFSFFLSICLHHLYQDSKICKKWSWYLYIQGANNLSWKASGNSRTFKGSCSFFHFLQSCISARVPYCLSLLQTMFFSF